MKGGTRSSSCNTEHIVLDNNLLVGQISYCIGIASGTAGPVLVGFIVSTSGRRKVHIFTEGAL